MRGRTSAAVPGLLMAALVACSTGAADDEPVAFDVASATESEPVVEEWDDFDRLYANAVAPATVEDQQLIEVAAGAVAKLRSEHDYAALRLTLRADAPAMEPGLPVAYVVDAPGPGLLSENVRARLKASFASLESAYFQGALEVDRSLGDYRDFRVFLTLEQPDWEQQPPDDQWQRYEEFAERYAARHEEAFVEGGIVWREAEVELAREVAADFSDDAGMDGDALWIEIEQSRDWFLDRSTTSLVCSADNEQADPSSFRCEPQ